MMTKVVYFHHRDGARGHRDVASCLEFHLQLVTFSIHRGLVLKDRCRLKGRSGVYEFPVADASLNTERLLLVRMRSSL